MSTGTAAIWVARLAGVLSIVLLVDLLASAAARQILVLRNERATIEAELSQEPYRGSDWGRAYWEEIAQYSEEWDPSVVYRVGNMHGRFINVDAGVRRTDIPEYPAAVHRHLVFLFGGSAVWGHGARDDNTVPSWLARVSAARGDPFEVRNYAESGWLNWQGIAYLLQKLSDGERPELVVFYSGVNETLSARRWPHVRRPIWDTEWYSSALHESVVQRTRPLTRTLEYYRGTSLALSMLLPTSPRIPVSPTAQEVTVGTVVADYAADKQVVERLGRAYGFATMFVWQPTIAAKRILSAQERTYAGWLPSSQETTPELEWWSMSRELREMYDTIGRGVVSHHDVVDLSHAFDDTPTTAFIDWMHTSESGNELVARALYDTLAPALPDRR